ncbi:MAG: SMP-30/gluconolactonase/LRE family protein [Myxococcota bacterium]
MITLAILACKGPATPTDTDTDTPVPEETGDTDVVPTADTAPDLPVVQCSALLSSGLPNQPVPGARAYHGLAFGEDGSLVGSNGTSLIKALDFGVNNLFVPNVGSGQQMGYLPSGELVMSADNGGIVGVMPNGSQRTIASNVNAYGLRIGPDGNIYTANQQSVDVIDPVTGDRTTWFSDPGIYPKVLDFAVDHSKVYIGTLGNNGRVFEVDLDPGLVPVGDARVLGMTGGNWHDGLGVDACGNVYVAEYNTTSLYRISPSGQVQTLVNYPFQQYGHGLEWGNGTGPWRLDALYIPQPYDNNTVHEIVIGVPAGSYAGGGFVIVP